jgi:hypothetical protein
VLCSGTLGAAGLWEHGGSLEMLSKDFWTIVYVNALLNRERSGIHNVKVKERSYILWLSCLQFIKY